jgi:hypothetical protein
MVILVKSGKEFPLFSRLFPFWCWEESVPGDGNFDDLVKSKISPALAGGEQGEGDK